MFACVPGWRNGRRCGLKIRCPKGRAGSTPALGTTTESNSYGQSLNERELPVFASCVPIVCQHPSRRCWQRQNSLVMQNPGSVISIYNRVPTVLRVLRQSKSFHCFSDSRAHFMAMLQHAYFGTGVVESVDLISIFAAVREGAHGRCPIRIWLRTSSS